MPQITVEKKFFQELTDKFLLNLATEIDKVYTVTEFHRLQKNITGGYE
jgi:hypothetical protein